MRARAALSVVLVGAGLGLPAGAAGEGQMSLQEIVLRGKPATVLVVAEVGAEVTLDCGAGARRVNAPPFRETGTGWYADSNGWVVTNAHVVQPAHAPPRWLVNEVTQKAVLAACVGEELVRRGLQPGDRPDVEDDLRRAALARALPGARAELKPSLFILMANGFRLPAKVVKYSPPVTAQPGVMSGRDLALLEVEVSEMPAFRLADSKHVKIGDPLHILGYPGVVLTHELLNSTAKVEASVTNGAISGLKQDVQNQPVIQTDAPAAWGNSGGPVVNDRGDVIGVLTFVSLAPGPEGALVQGFNFIIPADAVRAFLQDTKVDLADQGPFNAHWWGGLRRFFSGDYAGALAGFRAADRLQPEFPDIRRLMAEAEERITNPPPRPFPWRPVLAGLALLAWPFVRRARRRRLLTSPADVVRLGETGARPVVLDAREPALYRASAVRIPGAVRVAPGSLDAAVAGLGDDRRRPIVVYCTSDAQAASLEVARGLRALGYRDARALRGGLGGWSQAGLPLEAKAVEGGAAAGERPAAILSDRAAP
jgi:S1-C subfamily serine protease/rhodanese-related sulfurtransferase